MTENVTAVTLREFNDDPRVEGMRSLLAEMTANVVLATGEDYVRVTVISLHNKLEWTGYIHGAGACDNADNPDAIVARLIAMKHSPLIHEARELENRAEELRQQARRKI